QLTVSTTSPSASRICVGTTRTVNPGSPDTWYSPRCGCSVVAIACTCSGVRERLMAEAVWEGIRRDGSSTNGLYVSGLAWQHLFGGRDRSSCKTERSSTICPGASEARGPGEQRREAERQSNALHFASRSVAELHPEVDSLRPEIRLAETERWSG